MVDQRAFRAYPNKGYDWELGESRPWRLSTSHSISPNEGSFSYVDVRARAGLCGRLFSMFHVLIRLNRLSPSRASSQHFHPVATAATAAAGKLIVNIDFLLRSAYYSR